MSAYAVCPIADCMKSLDDLLLLPWIDLYPARDSVAVTSPSSVTNSDYCVRKSSPQVVESLVTAMKQIFANHSHCGTFWSNFNMGVIHSVQSLLLSCNLKQANEATVRDSLLSPLLHLIIERMSLIPNKADSPTFTPILVSEAPIPLYVASGRKPAVDYMLVLNGDNGPFNIVPIEAKVNIEANDVYQLASYMMKLSTFERLETKALVGVLISSVTYQFVFSPFKWPDSNQAVPVMCASPQLQWRSVTGTIWPIPENLLMLCFLHLIRIDRIDFHRTEYIDVLKSITEKVHRNPFSIGDLCLEEQPANPLIKMIHDLREEVSKLKRSNEELKQELKRRDEERKRSDEELKAQICSIQEFVGSPKKRRRGSSS